MAESLNKQLKTLLGRRAATLVPGAFNALTAKMIADEGFEAVYVSGAGVTNAYLGIPDLGLISLSELADNVAAMRDVTARTIPWIPPTDRTGRGRPVDGIMPAGGLTETTRQTTSAEDPSSDAISFCLPIKWRLTACTRYGYPKPTHQCGASGGRGGHARPAEGWRAEPAIALGEFVQPCTT